MSGSDRCWASQSKECNHGKDPYWQNGREQVLRLVDLVGNDERGIYAAWTAFPHMGGAIFLEAWTTLKERRDEAWREDQKLWREDQEINWILNQDEYFRTEQIPTGPYRQFQTMPSVVHY